MRKFYAFILSFFIGVLTVTGQVTFQKNNPTQINQPYPYMQNKAVNNKTISCTDTVRYPGSKLTGQVEADTMDISTYIGAVSQAYYFSGSGTISGISAYVLLDLDGIPGNSTPVSAIIKVYNINAQNIPTTMIDSAIVQVVDIGWQEQALMFSNPVAVSDSFAVAFEVNPAAPANPYYTTNNSTAQNGNDEALSCFTTSPGNWLNAYLTYGNGWDIDMMLSPIFTQSITSSYTTDKDTICVNDTVAFTNTSVHCTDSMFNLFHTTSSPLYTWDFNDGSGTYNPFDTSYVFANAGAHNTQLKANYYGYSLNCIDSSNHLIMVYDTAVANFGFSHLGSGNYQFNDSTLAGVTSWSWDFGDSSPLDTNQNPTHTFASPGNYYVCLTVTNGCNTDTYCDTVSFVLSVDDYYAANYVKVYPVPANKYFNVAVPNNYFGGKVIVTDVVGQLMKSVEIEDQDKVKVTTEDITSGIYFVSIDYNGERVFTKRIVIDR